jgi:hypothetical protein
MPMNIFTTLLDLVFAALLHLRRACRRKTRLCDTAGEPAAAQKRAVLCRSAASRR